MSLRRSPLAFTLTELLLTIAIVCIVMALLLVALPKVMASVNTAKCAGNLHQIGMALTLYANENNGTYPDIYRDPDNKVTWRVRLSRTLGLAPDERYSNSKVWFCPSAKIMPASLAPLVAHYSYNNQIVALQWQRKMAAPPNPSQIVLVGESNANSESFKYSQSPAFTGDVVTSYRFSHPDHTANFLFVDGHVAQIRYVDNGPSVRLFYWW